MPSESPLDGVAFKDFFSTDGSTDFGYAISAPGTIYAGSTASEMAYLYYVNLGNPSYYTLDGAITGCYVSPADTCLDQVGPFINLQQWVYCSGTNYEDTPNSAWYFTMVAGGQLIFDKRNDRVAWAVRDGDVAAIPEPANQAMLLVGVGLVAAVVRRHHSARL